MSTTEQAWPEITAERIDAGDARSGVYTVYKRGSLELDLENGYEVRVKPGDMISVYTKILYDSFGNRDGCWHTFMRAKTGVEWVESLEDLTPITDYGRIVAGETLYHAPSVEEHNQAPQSRALAPVGSDLPVRDAPDVRRLIGCEIVAYDDYRREEDWVSVGWGESVTTFGDVEFHDITSFVDGVIGAAAGDRIALLHLQAHGYTSGIHFGDPVNGRGVALTNASFNQHANELRRLRPHFADGAWVAVRACHVGQNLQLLQSLRDAWGVNIFAGLSYWRNVSDYNTGNYVVLTRDGQMYQTTTMPDEIQHSTWRVWRRARN
ncbi:MAG: hypothetical protein AAGJ28_07465 [Pseudomonadota bacterium]